MLILILFFYRRDGKSALELASSLHHLDIVASMSAAIAPNVPFFLAPPRFESEEVH